MSGRHCSIPVTQKAEAKRYLSQAGHRGPLDNLGKYLFSKGYIVKASFDERAAWDHRYGQSQYKPDHMELMLLSTEDCNFRCIYCSQQFKRGSMQPHVRKAVLGLIEGRMPRLNSLDVQWFGGEPLFGFDAMSELAPKIQELARKRGAILSSSITTNAYLMTSEVSRNLLDWDIRVFQITLDGTAEDHDAHRPLKGGEKTFQTIIKNLLDLQAYDESFRVALRINADRTNSPRLRPLFEELSFYFKDDPRFKLRFKAVGQWGSDGDASLDVFGSLTEERETLVQLRSQARDAGMGVESLGVELQPDYVCYASRPYAMIVGADGKLMKCSVVLDTMPANIVGQINEDGSVRIDDEKFLAWVKPFYKDDPECQKCFFLPSCQGASCTLPRFIGKRPCPPVKLQIQHSLRDLYEQEA